MEGLFCPVVEDCFVALEVVVFGGRLPVALVWRMHYMRFIKVQVSRFVSNITYVPAPLLKFGKRYSTTNWTPSAITLAKLHKRRLCESKMRYNWQFHVRLDS